MKILFLSENYFPKVSGVPVVVRYLAEGLAKLGHHIALVTSQFKDCPSSENIGGVDVHRFRLSKSRINLYSGEIDNYVNFVINYKCDVIVLECVMCATTDLILPHLCKIKAKTVLHSHGISGLHLHPFERKEDLIHTIANTYHWTFYSCYLKFIFPKYIKQLDAILCLSEVDNTIPYCKKFGKDVQILGNAVEDVFLLPTREVKQENISQLRMPYFLSVAYYNQIKNQINILKEFYKSGIKDYAMVFIGPFENEYYYKLLKVNESLSKEFGERKILFLTRVDRELIPDIIGNAKLYIVGSTIEQFSIAIIEAMAKRVPFISTNVGNARLLPGGITINNIQEMHIQIDELIKNVNLYKNYSDAGKKFAHENCRIESVVNKLETILKTTLNN